MKFIRLAAGLLGVLGMLSVSENVQAGFDDDYVQVNDHGAPIVPVPRVRHRKMPKVPKVQATSNASNNANGGSGFDNPPQAIQAVKPPTVKITKEADESRQARLEQRAKDAEEKKQIREALRFLNNRRHQYGLPTVSCDGCNNKVCKCAFTEGSQKLSCTGSAESFLIDESPGFTCGGSVCFLNKDNGKLECDSQNVAASSPTPAPDPSRGPCRLENGIQVCGHPRDCVIDHEHGVHSCPPLDNQNGGPTRRPANDAI